ncbi:prefoldin subunit [Candidatus Woesearchaeota archaeon]|nr:prefoldin subunit [Candidatus Woesearchaeota archaeon]
MSSDKVNQLQVLQHNLQNILMQKQQLESQVAEIDSALEGLTSTDKAYKIVGRIMIASAKEDLQKDLESSKEVQELRLKNLVNQESSLKKKFAEAQEEAMKELKSKQK